MNFDTFQWMLAWVAVGFFLMALAFDIVVSYSVYKTHSEYFFNLEQSDGFKKIARGEMPYTLVFQSMFGLLPVLFYRLEARFKKSIFLYLLILSVILSVFMGSLHFYGGSSWWR